MFQLQLCAPSERIFRVRKSNTSGALRVAEALARRHKCDVEVTADDGEHIATVAAPVLREAQRAA